MTGKPSQPAIVRRLIENEIAHQYRDTDCTSFDSARFTADQNTRKSLFLLFPDGAGTPAGMRALRTQLAMAGFFVVCMAYPGHQRDADNQPFALDEFTAEAAIEKAQMLYRGLLSEGYEVHLLGVSTGCLLAHYLQLTHPSSNKAPRSTHLFSPYFAGYFANNLLLRVKNLLWYVNHGCVADMLVYSLFGHQLLLSEGNMIFPDPDKRHNIGSYTRKITVPFILLDEEQRLMKMVKALTKSALKNKTPLSPTQLWVNPLDPYTKQNGGMLLNAVKYRGAHMAKIPMKRHLSADEIADAVVPFVMPTIRFAKQPQPSVISKTPVGEISLLLANVRRFIMSIKNAYNPVGKLPHLV